MAAEEIGVHYMSHKVSSVRWRPSLKAGLEASRVFAAGSWDDATNNTLEIYAVGNNDAADISPISSCSHPGDVTDIQFLSFDFILTTSSTGRLSLVEHQRMTSQLLVPRQQWELTPGYVLSTVAVKGDDVMVAGEKGEIHILNVGISSGGVMKNPAQSNQKSNNQVLKAADSFAITSAIFLRPQEILTANSSGQLKLWDLRTALKTEQAQPTKILSLQGDRVGVNAVAQHPTQPHLIAAGAADGLLAIWDLRQDNEPATLLQGHSATIWDVKFHPSHPDHLFTCADDGKVLHWDCAAATGANKSILGTSMPSSRLGPLTVGGPTQQQQQQSSWISSGTNAKKASNVRTSSMLPSYFDMPVNCVDVESDILLCATDAEAIFSVNNLNIH